MANWFAGNEETKFWVTIPRYNNTNYYTEFELIIQFPNNLSWRLAKRYSEFYSLYNELSSIDPIYKVYFPPKKVLKANSDAFLTQRRKMLEMYMNDIISKCTNYIPRALASFLEFDKYEIHGITTKLAKTFALHGQVILTENRSFEISVFTIYAINQRMISPAPTNIYNKPKEDFGNVLEIIESVKKVKVVPHPSYIKSESLLFDISIFSGAKTLELNSVNVSNLRGLYKMNPIVETLKAHHCLKSLEDILYGDVVYRSSSFEDLINFDGPWRCVTNVDFSNNSITSIDKSIVILKQVSKLNLSHNHITEIDHLSHLVFLTELDLSFNNLSMSQTLSFSNKLGSVKRLILRGNKLTKLTPIDRLFSLEYLDISENEVNDFRALLSFGRLSCLETLIFKSNPICSHVNFPEVIFDLFLDQINAIQINGNNFVNLPSQTQMNIYTRRDLKESILQDNRNILSNVENSGETGLTAEYQNLLLSIDIDVSEIVEPDSILNIPDVFNSIVYWFFSAAKKSVVPSKFLWCTEMFSPNKCIKPALVLLITCSSLGASVLKCSIKSSIQNGKNTITIQARHFIDLNKNMKNLIIGADKSYVRFDMTSDRYLYLVNNSVNVDSFMGHLYHIDNEIAGYGDSRLIILNEEDRLDSLRRFITVWRNDLINTMVRSGDNRQIKTDVETEILFSSRAMLQMQNGFQLLLTVVVTRQMLCLVDERIFDWQEHVKKSISSDFSYSNSSLQSSSSGQFQFLRTNAYFFHQIKSCVKSSHSKNDNGLENFCPIFGHSIQIVFYPSQSNTQESLFLYFESDQQTDNICQIINQLFENEDCTFPINVSSSEPVAPILHEIPAHLKYLTLSYREIQLSLSLNYPKLSSLASSSQDEILSFYFSEISDSEHSKINGIIWSKFIYQSFDSSDSSEIDTEIPGLIYLSSNKICIAYEVEEQSLPDPDAFGDQELDQADLSSIPTRYDVMSINLNEIFKIYVGFYNQWVTLCCRKNENCSENVRLVIITRNSDLTKQLISWLKQSFKDLSIDDSFSEKLDNAHDNSNIEELLFQIRKAGNCDDVNLIHYTSVEDIRFDNLTGLSSSVFHAPNVFTYAVVISTANISIIRHNVAEYPVRYFSRGDSKSSPSHLQYQIMIVIRLFECVQLQLPGHDKSQLVIIIQSSTRSRSSSVSSKIQLSINCQKEQKQLIDSLRQQWMTCLRVETPMRVNVC